MKNRESRIFWDIEKEKTWRIYALFAFLLLLYLITVFITWLMIRSLIYLRLAMYNINTPFRIITSDTWIILVIATIAAVIHWYYSNTKVVDRILSLLGAKTPDKYDKYHHIFQNVVDEIETSAGGLKVERYILPNGAMNAFALADLSGSKVIGITEGLLSRLSRDELQSVVAHEMVHIVSHDCLQTTMACSLFSIYSEALSQLGRVLSRAGTSSSSFFAGTRSSNTLAYAIFTIPILFVLFVMDIMSQFLNMFISREREYRADASAVKLTRNPISLASALYKIGTHWRGAGYGGERLSPIFIMSPQFNQLDENEGLVATLFSTHPPLAKRLQIILNLAHADLAQITEHLQKNEKIKTETEIRKTEIKFIAEHDNKWSGPFTVVQLMTLEWLAPETKLRLEGNDEIIKANGIPFLTAFFQKRDEPIWKIRRLCPICRQWMIVQEYEGLHIWQCAFCNGTLIEQDKLPRIFVRKEKGFTENVQRLATVLSQDAEKKHPEFKLLLDTSHPKPCPKCGKPMTRKFYSYAYHVEIDECSLCKLVWFDATELEILQCLIEMEERT